MLTRSPAVPLFALLAIASTTSHALDVYYDDTTARGSAYVGKSNYQSDSAAPLSAPATVIADINGVATSVAQTGYASVSAPPVFGVPAQSASILGNGTVNTTAGDFNYQFGGKASADASFGQMAATAIGHVQGTYPSFESVYSYGYASAGVSNDFILMKPLSPGDATPPGSGPQILTITMNVTGHTLAAPDTLTPPKATFTLSMTDDPTGSSPTPHPLQETWTVSEVGDWNRTFSLNYEISTANITNCLDPFLSKYAGCGFIVSARSGISLQSGDGPDHLIDVNATLTWKLSDPDAWKSLSTSARHWGENTPAVPEPETWALMMAGLGVLGLFKQRFYGAK